MDLMEILFALVLFTGAKGGGGPPLSCLTTAHVKSTVSDKRNEDEKTCVVGLLTTDFEEVSLTGNADDNSCCLVYRDEVDGDNKDFLFRHYALDEGGCSAQKQLLESSPCKVGECYPTRREVGDWARLGSRITCVCDFPPIHCNSAELVRRFQHAIHICLANRAPHTPSPLRPLLLLLGLLCRLC